MSQETPKLPPAAERPEVGGFSRSDIEQIACNIVDLVAFKPENDIYDVARHLGAKIDYVRLNDWLTEQQASLVVRGPRDLEMFVPRFTPEARDRFLIAHNLGHYFLHTYSGEVPATFLLAGNPRLEAEADYFASAFLMPRQKVQQIATGKAFDPVELRDLAVAMRVSPNALTERISSLQTLDSVNSSLALAH